MSRSAPRWRATTAATGTPPRGIPRTSAPWPRYLSSALANWAPASLRSRKNASNMRPPPQTRLGLNVQLFADFFDTGDARGNLLGGFGVVQRRDASSQGHDPVNDSYPPQESLDRRLELLERDQMIVDGAHAGHVSHSIR